MIELQSAHKGIFYEVAFQGRIGHRCGYIYLPKGHPLYEWDYMDIDIDIHGGFTYGAMQDDWWVIGFDCAHCDDAPDLDTLKVANPRVYEYMKEMMSPETGKVWSMEDVQEELKRAIDQIVKENPHD